MPLYVVRRLGTGASFPYGNEHGSHLSHVGFKVPCLTVYQCSTLHRKKGTEVPERIQLGINLRRATVEIDIVQRYIQLMPKFNC